MQMKNHMTPTQQTIRGIAAAPGIALGKVYWLREDELDVEKRKNCDPKVEKQRLDNARAAVSRTLQQMVKSMQDQPEEAAIFDAHIMMLNDADLLALAQSQLTFGAEYAWNEAIQHYAAQMESLPDPYFQARASDIRDIGKQVLRALLNLTAPDLSDLEKPVVVLAQDLTPSDTSRMDRTKILGFATVEGSATSHTAILAKALGIPAVVGAGQLLMRINQGTFVILDGDSGVIVVEPDDALQDRYERKQAKADMLQKAALDVAHKPAITVDGHQVEVVANVGSLDEAQQALNQGAEGIGLLRTEFLYLDRHTAPTEDEQYAIYHTIFQVMAQRPVVIRTLDVGGDKSPTYMDLGQEANPFLGLRGIRVGMAHPELFQTQIRAILRAAPDHDVRIMFPMIATLEELRQAKAMLKEIQSELISPAAIQIGIMVEIPAVVQMVDVFAEEVDFFSVGTNDLTQYTFAVDRTNPKVANLADACHPAILRQIAHVIAEAHKQGTWVGVCGELAGDPDAIPVLLGLALDEFSMSPALIPQAKSIIRSWTLRDARTLAQDALNLESARAVRELVHQVTISKKDKRSGQNGTMVYD